MARPFSRSWLSERIIIKKYIYMNSMMSSEPKEDELYYEGLSATVIDIVKSVVTDKRRKGMEACSKECD